MISSSLFQQVKIVCFLCIPFLLKITEDLTKNCVLHKLGLMGIGSNQRKTSINFVCNSLTTKIENKNE
jgi:hypothetical protein